LVVDCCIDAELAVQVFAFFIAAGRADDATTLELRDLADDDADRSGGAGDDDSLAFLWLADVEQAEGRGQAGTSKHAECGRRRNTGNDSYHSVGVGDVVQAPAELAADDVTRLKLWRRRLDHFADSPALDDLSDFERRDVRTALTHPATQVRIDGD